MNEPLLQIISARFERMERPVGPGWVMRLSVVTQKIKHVALPFTARVGNQRVRQLGVTAEGDRFEGYLERVPRPGDRLYVGYGKPDKPTNVIYQAEGARPPVA